MTTGRVSAWQADRAATLAARAIRLEEGVRHLSTLPSDRHQTLRTRLQEVRRALDRDGIAHVALMTRDEANAVLNQHKAIVDQAEAVMKDAFRGDVAQLKRECEERIRHRRSLVFQQGA